MTSSVEATLVDPAVDEAPGSRRFATLDGLRGIAVLAVVIEHAWSRALPGGFAGVDMFFVLSGFLITRNLVGELGRTEHVDLVAFYSRRFRRILPAALLTIVAVCLLYAVLLGPAVPAELRTEALAATFSVSNILFASQATDYFAANPAGSPFLHFWSLAVEEQFYLVWPALLLALVIVGRRLGRPAMRRFLPVAAIVGLALVSFGLTLFGKPTNAFYLLPHRGWELMVGGLLAWLMRDGLLRLPASLDRFRILGVVAGIGMVVLVFVAAPELGRWPGKATLLPVFGTALLIAGGDRMPGSRMFTVPPLRFFGRISYALYLWHWPMLAAAALLALPATSATLAATLAAVLIAIVIATGSTIYMEEPVRSTKRPAFARRGAIGAGLAGIAAVGLAAIVLTTLIPRVAAGADGLSSALSVVRNDRERLIDDHCYTSLGSAKVVDCAYGAAANPDGSPVKAPPAGMPDAVLFGDSHAMHWSEAMDDWATSKGLALVPLARSGCPAVDAPMVATTARTKACTAWRADALARIEALHPVITVVSSSTGVGFTDAGHVVRPRIDGAGPWVAPAARMLEEVRRRSGSVLFIGDVPRPGFSVPDCLAAHRWDTTACVLPLSVVMPAALVAAEAAAAREAGVTFFDPTPDLCGPASCDWMTGSRIGWVDDHHLSRSGELHVLPQLTPILDELAGRA